MHLSRGARRLYHLIQGFEERARLRRCIAGQEFLRRQLRCSLRSIKRWLAELVRASLVGVIRRFRRSNAYRILAPLLAPPICFQQRSKSIQKTEQPTVVVVWPNPERRPPDRAQTRHEPAQLGYEADYFRRLGLAVPERWRAS